MYPSHKYTDSVAPWRPALFSLIALSCAVALALGLLSVSFINRSAKASQLEAGSQGQTATREASRAQSTTQRLSDSDWASIRQAYEQSRHSVFSVGSGEATRWEARNPGQQWQAQFDGRGFAVKPDGANWQWGLELRSYGFPNQTRTVNGQAKVTTHQTRVAYNWDEKLEEWYINDQRGLEQGFTLRERPEGAGERLELNLAVRGGLRPRVQANGREVSFVNAHGQAAINYNGLKVQDADGRELAASFEASADGLRLVVDEREARYPVTIDPIAQQAYVKASNTDSGDNFGEAVAISGDTAVVGAPREDSNATGVNGNQADNTSLNSGAAYVFVRNAGVWTQQAYLKASNTGSNDLFGTSVAISGDTIVVGANFEDGNTTGVNGADNNLASNSGAAYVFVRVAGVWSQQAYLKASNTGSGDQFGWTVSVSGDTVVVGAPFEDGSTTGVNGADDNLASNAGAAYVFLRTAGVWAQQAYLKASNTEFSDQFGAAVAISGDTIVVGANNEDSSATGVNGNQLDNSASNAGAAYVFVRNAGVWTQQAYLKASNTGAGDEFGGSVQEPQGRASVAISGDTIVVGARLEDSNSTGVNGADNNLASASGAAYVFVRNGTTWSQQAYLKASNTDAGDLFGGAVSISGNLIAIGAVGESSNARGINGNQADNSILNAGAVYAFIRNGSTWSQAAYLKASNNFFGTGGGGFGGGDYFGIAVGVSGDTVIVGAREEDSSATGVNPGAAAEADDSASEAGAAYIFIVSLTNNVSDQIAGSVLFYNLYTSDPTNLSRQNTRINITNTNPDRSIAVHLFFMDGSNCSPADAFICLTPSQTISFLTSDYDPGTTGYIIAIASDTQTGCPINFNWLIGDEFVKLTSGHMANLGAEAIIAVADQPVACAAGAVTATLNFDSASYAPVPRTLAVDNFPSRLDGNDTLIILNRFDGDLNVGVEPIGSLVGLLFDEAEQPFSFTFTAESCQFRSSLSNTFPRILQRLDTVVSSGRTGWMRFSATKNIGLFGAMINANAGAGANAFNQGHNLHKLSFTNASLTIPIIVTAC